MSHRREVVVIGAGIAGLACAHRLREQGVDVEVLEAGDRVGGALRSESIDGHTVDLGPQTIHSRDPELFEHLSSIGLDGAIEVAGSGGKKRFIVVDGRAVELPGGPLSLLTTKALSWRGKLKLFGEPFAPPGPGGDESADDFVRRRLGDEVADRMLDPFVSGVHAGDPTTLSMRAAFPKLLEAERQHGSLTRWAVSRVRAGRRSGKKKSARPRVRSKLFSFTGGLAAWPRALSEAIGEDRVHTGSPATMIQPGTDGGWVIGSEGRTIATSAVVLAVPAPVAADLVEGISTGGARVLRDIPYSPVTTVHLTYRRSEVAHPLDGFGMLIPSRERRPVLGILWMSSLFDSRAVGDLVQTTSFVGGARFPELAGLSDSELVDLVHGQHEQILGASSAPGLRYVARWTHAIPRMEFGHVDRLNTLERMEAANPGIHLAGSYAGSGPSVPSCWSRGREVAEAILSERRVDTISTSKGNPTR